MLNPKLKLNFEHMEEGFRIATANFFLGAFLIFLLAGCTNSRNYMYPSWYELERQRVCRHVSQRKTIKFLVSKNKIHAIAPVHFGGLPCKMKEIKEVADKVGAIIYEDAAQAFGASFSDGSKIGSCKYSDMTVFSFHPVKSIATGEGGVVTTNDKNIYEKLLRLRNHGIERNQDNFQLKSKSITNEINNPWYYEMQELGYNYRITDIQCALGLSQLKKIDKFINKRRELAKKYDSAFENLKNCKPVQKNMRDFSSNHLYVLKINFKKLNKTRASLMEEFESAGIVTQVHYIPVISHPYFQKKNYKENNFPNSYEYYNGALSIPLFYDLTDKQQLYIIDQVKKFIVEMRHDKHIFSGALHTGTCVAQTESPSSFVAHPTSPDACDI